MRRKERQTRHEKKRFGERRETLKSRLNKKIKNGKIKRY